MSRDMRAELGGQRSIQQRARAGMNLRLAVFLLSVQLLQVTYLSSPSCSDEDTCDAEEKSWLGPLEGLLHDISSGVQRNVIQSSEGIFVSVKTAIKYHSTRLPPILFTWFQNIAPSQVT